MPARIKRFRQSRAFLPTIFVAVIALLVLVVVSVPPHSGEVTFRVTQQFYAGATYDADPRTLVEVIDGASVYDAGDSLMVQYDWETCDGCGNSVWADNGLAMYNANVAAQNAFWQDKCYRAVISRHGDDDLGHKVALFSPEDGEPKEIQCP